MLQRVSVEQHRRGCGPGAANAIFKQCSSGGFRVVEGRIYNQKSGVGVASAEITVDYNPTRIMTDELGNYRVKVLPAQHSIGAQSSDYSVIPSSVM